VSRSRPDGHPSLPRPVNDRRIAACCIAYGLPLATLSVKDFADFAEHDGPALIRL
jgi:toxin FitB